MAFDRAELLEKILAGYEGNYDISRVEEEKELPLVAAAELHVSESGFILVRKAQMWNANSNEFVYIFSAGHIEENICEKAIDYAYREGMSKIDLKNAKDHMCTRVVVLILCDDSTPAATERIRKCRLYKSFQFSLKGWMEVHTVICSLKDGNVVSNRYGHETADYIRTILNPEPQKKNRRIMGIVRKMLE